MKKLLLILISFTTVFYARAQEQDSLDIANKYYASGQFRQAENIYENLIEDGYGSADLYYNLGNTYYKQNIIAPAILNYEKALNLAPNDEDIKYNLELANRFVVDKIEVLPVFFITAWIRSLRNMLPSNMWAIISVSTFVISLLFLSFYLYSRGIGFKRLAFWLSFLMIIGSVVSFAFSYQQKQKVISGNTAIVMSPSVTVKSSPDDSGTDLFVIHEGTKVWVEDKISEWNEIKLSDGSKGWLQKDDIEVI